MLREQESSGKRASLTEEHEETLEPDAFRRLVADLDVLERAEKRSRPPLSSDLNLRQRTDRLLRRENPMNKSEHTGTSAYWTHQ